MPQLSFVIPAYNASATIVRCLDSIYNLALAESYFEVICIDDCSKDNTIAIIEEYAKLHSNITLLCQTENHRQGAARNKGVAIAKGKYIVLVDSDDETDKGVLEAWRLAEANELDMVAMHYVNINEKGDRTEKQAITLNGIFTGMEMQTKHSYWCSGPVPYLYNTAFLQKVNYPFAEDVLFEDSDFVNVHLYHARRMMYNSACSYRVHYNSSSTTHTLSYKHMADYLLLGTRMLRFYDSLEEQNSTYALGIKEGGCYNVWQGCRRLFKLQSPRDVLAFFERVDFYTDRKALLQDTQSPYFWNWWTKLCLRWKFVAIPLASICIFTYKLYKLIK
ncbi:MAG: glycosyltransferase family 2 protein [Paludibacteraceae bacterium]|nr:glycosyltransferase family 2 protein [Paludibacteraceae bacterium]